MERDHLRVVIQKGGPRRKYVYRFERKGDTDQDPMLIIKGPGNGLFDDRLAYRWVLEVDPNHTPDWRGPHRPRRAGHAKHGPMTDIHIVNPILQQPTEGEET